MRARASSVPRGTVLFDGQNVELLAGNEGALRDFRRKNIGFVFQKANLIPFLTAIENVALALIIDDWRREGD